LAENKLRARVFKVDNDDSNDTRKGLQMKVCILILLAALLIAPSAFAVPSLQLFIDGATYDWGSQTWVVTGGSFDLYVVSANQSKDDVVVSLALMSGDDPTALDVTFGGDNIDDSDWLFGYAPIDNAPGDWDGGEDLPPHGIFPTWYTEMHTGAYDLSQSVGDVQPDGDGDFWNPATGDGQAHADGQIKMFHVEAAGVYTYVHFDAYTLNPDGTIDQFAPFSHDAQTNYAPEPGTAALLGMGLLGMGAFNMKRKKS
jgi:hypothetical protein